jgi:hypothetical protein
LSVGKPYRPVRSGQPLTAENMNNNIVRGSQRGAMYSGNVNRRNFPDGVAVDLPGGQAIPGSSVYFRWAEVQSVEADYLVCKFYNPVSGTTDGADFGVAKPFLLQQSTFDGQTISYIDGESITYTADGTDPEYKRTHNDGVTSAAFVVTPNWFVGEQIIVMNLPTYVDGALYNWVELALGRYWAEL